MSERTHDLEALSWTFDDRAFNHGDLSVVDELIAPGFVNHTPLPGQSPDREGIRAYVPQFREGFPNLACHNELMLAKGDVVAHLLVFEGTHSGTFLGKPATGRSMTMRSYDFQRWKDGRMTERWSSADTADLDAILGVGDGR